MRRYDRDWKKIGDYVGTKTVIQVRFRGSRATSTTRRRDTSVHPPKRYFPEGCPVTACVTPCQSIMIRQIVAARAGLT